MRAQVRPAVGWDGPVLDLLRHGQEGLLDVGGLLGRRLEERDGERVGELLGRAVLDDLLGDEVVLVANQELVDALDRVPVDLLQPLLDVGEGVCDRSTARELVRSV